MAKILIVEDHIESAENLRDWLTTKMFVVDVVHDGETALEYLLASSYDLILLDLTLPELDGFNVLQQYRIDGGEAPVIVTSALNSIEEKERALDLGADDYIVKPYDLRELFSRIKAVLRRPQNKVNLKITRGDLIFDPITGELTAGNQIKYLQKQESALLELFMRNPERPFSVTDLLRRAWSTDSETTPETVRVQILKLRNKLNSLGFPDAIQTMRGLGYVFQ